MKYKFGKYFFLYEFIRKRVGEYQMEYTIFKILKLHNQISKIFINQ